MPVPSEIFVRRGSQSTRAFQWPNEAMRADWISKRKAVTQRNDGLLDQLSIGERNLYRAMSGELLKNSARLSGECEAGNIKAQSIFVAKDRVLFVSLIV